METENKKLAQYLKSFSKEADDWFGSKGAYELVNKYYSFNKNFFTKENLEKAEWEDFQEIKNNLHSLKNPAIAGHKAFGKPNHEIAFYRKQFLQLLDKSKSIEERYNSFNVAYLGEGVLRELLGYLFPDECYAVNGRTINALNFLNINISGKKITKGDEYIQYINAMNGIKDLYKEIVKPRTDLPVNLEVDQFMSWISDTQIAREVSHEENVNENVQDNKEKINIPLNQILYGPPGTGKTYNTIIKALMIVGRYTDNQPYSESIKIFNSMKFDSGKSDNNWQIDFITFHQNYSYEEFIEGISPNITNDKSLSYQLKEGPLKRIVDAAINNPDKNYVLVIDEINRGNISKIFGELITLLEEDKRIGNDCAITLPLMYSQKNFGLPANLYIIGTMNTADKSIALVDIALRRRFKFIEMMPNADILSDIVINNTTLKDIFKRLNSKISVLIDRDHQIGHSYFMRAKNIDDLKQIWELEVLPLLNEYFYGDWEKMYKVIPGFIEKEEKNELLDGQCYYKWKSNYDFKDALEQI